MIGPMQCGGQFMIGPMQCGGQFMIGPMQCGGQFMIVFLITNFTEPLPCSVIKTGQKLATEER